MPPPRWPFRPPPRPAPPHPSPATWHRRYRSRPATGWCRIRRPTFAEFLLDAGEIDEADALFATLRERDPEPVWLYNAAAYSYAGIDVAESVVRDLRPQLVLALPDATRVLAAATIKADHTMAYADAFAAAAALAHRAALLTGDPELLLPSAPWDHEDLRSS